MLDVSIDLGLVGVGTVIASEQKKKKRCQRTVQAFRGSRSLEGRTVGKGAMECGCRCLRWASESLRRGHLNRTVGVKPYWLRRGSFSGLCKAKGKRSEIQGPLEGDQSGWSGEETPGRAE